MQEIYLFSEASELVVGPTKPSIHWALGGSFTGGKVAGHDANMSSMKIKHPLLHTSSWHAWGQIYLYFLGCDTMCLVGGISRNILFPFSVMKLEAVFLL